MDGRDALLRQFVALPSSAKQPRVLLQRVDRELLIEKARPLVFGLAAHSLGLFGLFERPAQPLTIAGSCLPGFGQIVQDRLASVVHRGWARGQKGVAI